MGPGVSDANLGCGSSGPLAAVVGKRRPPALHVMSWNIRRRMQYLFQREADQWGGEGASTSRTAGSGAACPTGGAGGPCRSSAFPHRILGRDLSSDRSWAGSSTSRRTMPDHLRCPKTGAAFLGTKGPVESPGPTRLDVLGKPCSPGTHRGTFPGPWNRPAPTDDQHTLRSSVRAFSAPLRSGDRPAGEGQRAPDGCHR